MLRDGPPDALESFRRFSAPVLIPPWFRPAGISPPLHTPDPRCLTPRSPSSFGSASWFLHRFPVLSLGQPHQIYARLLRRNSPPWKDPMTRTPATRAYCSRNSTQPTQHPVLDSRWVLISMVLPYDGSGASGLLPPWVGALHGVLGLHEVRLPWVRPRVEKATPSAQNVPETARRWETTTPVPPVRSTPGEAVLHGA